MVCVHVGAAVGERRLVVCARLRAGELAHGLRCRQMLPIRPAVSPA